MNKLIYKYCYRSSIALIVVIGCSQVPFSHGESATALHLFQLMSERLAIMKEVAAFKFQAGLPIEDKEREKIIIQNSIERATESHLESRGIQVLIEAQIQVAKDIQSKYFQQWQDAAPLPEAPIKDLQTEIRPRLAAISQDVIDTLGTFLMEGGIFNQELENEFYRTVKVENLSPTSQTLLFEALRNVRVEGDARLFGKS